MEGKQMSAREMFDRWLKEGAIGTTKEQGERIIRNIEESPDPEQVFENALYFILAEAVGEVQAGRSLRAIISNPKTRACINKRLAEYEQEMVMLMKIFLAYTDERALRSN